MAIISEPVLKRSKHETGMEHVQNLLKYGTDFSIYHSTANDLVHIKLNNLSSFLKEQEEDFYKALGISGGIKELNQRLQNINLEQNLSALDAGGAIMQEISNRFVFKDKSKSEEQKTQKQEQDIFTLINQALSGIDANSFMNRYIDGWTGEKEQIFNACTDALTEIFNGFQISNGLITYRFTAYGKGKSSFTGYYSSKQELGKAKVTVLNLNSLFARGKSGKITVEDNHFRIEADSSALAESVQVEFRDRIRPALESYLNTSYENKRLLENMSTEQIRTEVIDIVKQKGIKLSEDDLVAARRIAIGAGSGNISGFLGELQSRLYFKALFSGVKDANIIDAGASYIKSLSGATQMDPADTMIQIANQIFNIQVKNYAKGGAKWSGGTDKTLKVLGTEKKIYGTSSAAGFIRERLQISDNSLMEFFGAATWHNLNPQYANEAKYDEYKSLYGSFQSVFGSLKTSFDTFLPNIIRLEAIITGADGVENLQYENFYFQKGYMIPASGIVDGIIDALYNQPLDKIFTSSYGMYPGGSHYTHQVPFVDNYAGFAKETTISWNVTVSFSMVLRNLGL